jgi:formate C-acetyltransferase
VVNNFLNFAFSNNTCFKELRIVKFARTPDYNELFSGDPTWVTESIGGVGIDGRPLVTKIFAQYVLKLSGKRTDHNTVKFGSGAGPKLSNECKKRNEFFVTSGRPSTYCAKMSIKTSSIQYENDDIMRESYGDDYGIACW